MHGGYLIGFARTYWEITKQRTIRMLCRTCWLRKKLWDATWVWKSTFWSHTWIFFQKISAKSVANPAKNFTKTLWLRKCGAKAMDLKYVGRILLDTEEGCTWRQIPAKIICLYILEKSFCLFHEHVK